MPRITTLASAAGIADGGWVLVAVYIDGGASAVGYALALCGALLLLSAAVSLFWRREVFYVSAALSVLVGAVILLDASALSAVYVWGALALSAVSAGFNMLAARKGTAMSEQMNPMNLPVFG